MSQMYSSGFGPGYLRFSTLQANVFWIQRSRKSCVGELSVYDSQNEYGSSEYSYSPTYYNSDYEDSQEEGL